MRGLAVGLGVALVVTVAAVANSEEARTWLFNEGTDTASLHYGTPDSDDLVIAIGCEPQARTMRIVEFVGSNDLTPGSTATIRLTNGAASVEFSGQAVPNEMDGTVSVEVTTAIEPKLFAVLRAGPTLAIVVAGKQLTVPLEAAAPYLAPFEKACLKK